MVLGHTAYHCSWRLATRVEAPPLTALTLHVQVGFLAHLVGGGWEKRSRTHMDELYEEGNPPRVHPRAAHRGPSEGSYSPPNLSDRCHQGIGRWG